MPNSVSLGIDIAIFSLSALRDLSSADGHPLMGVGRLYPSWMLPLGLAHEVATVALLALDRPLGVLGCWAFIGGILHAQASPAGPFAHAGAKALIPVAVVCLATLKQTPSAAESCGTLSSRLGLGRLRPRGMVLLGAATCAAGFGFASMIAAANRP